MRCHGFPRVRACQMRLVAAMIPRLLPVERRCHPNTQFGMDGPLTCSRGSLTWGIMPAIGRQSSKRVPGNHQLLIGRNHVKLYAALRA
jgi:hypothetical protein